MVEELAFVDTAAAGDSGHDTEFEEFSGIDGGYHQTGLAESSPR
jgi:hypothetical protein